MSTGKEIFNRLVGNKWNNLSASDYVKVVQYIDDNDIELCSIYEIYTDDVNRSVLILGRFV